MQKSGTHLGAGFVSQNEPTHEEEEEEGRDRTQTQSTMTSSDNTKPIQVLLSTLLTIPFLFFYK